MKCKTALVSASALLVLLAGCEKGTAAGDGHVDTADYFVYDIKDFYAQEAMAAGDGAELYLAEHRDGRTVISEYGEDGDILNEYTVDRPFVYDMFFGDNALYIASDGKNGAAVDKLSLDTGETERVCEFPNLTDIRSISAYGGEVVVIGSDVTKKGLRSRYMINGYSPVQYPERGIYSFRNGSVAEIAADFPFEAAGYGDSVIIYGCDDSDGFYFRKYRNGELSSPYFNDQLGEIKALCAFGEDRYITNTASLFSMDTVIAGNISEKSFVDIMPDIFAFGGGRREMTANDGFCWYFDNDSQNLVRIKLSAYYKDNAAITLICGNLSDYPPFSCGRDIRRTRPGNEEAALKILARDRDFDICCLSSRDRISANIRQQGSFYPLNDVDGIREYVDGLFPCVKNACTNENGEIWCIPIAAQVPALIYNEEKCRELGFDPENADLNDYLGFLEKVGVDGELKAGCGFNSHIYAEAYFMKYLSENDSFDTPEFRKTAALLAEHFSYSSSGNGGIDSFIDASVAAAAAFENDIGGFVADMRYDGEYYAKSEALKISEIPFPAEGSSVSIVFMCVNPDSARLGDALEYVSDLARYTKTRKNDFLFTDKSAYSDTDAAMGLYEILVGGTVGFAYPNELYSADFERFLAGEITLDEFISEADRKLSIYLNE